MPILGLVIGLQSACIPAQSDDLGSSGTPVAEAQFPHPRDGSVVQVSEVSAEKEEASAEKEEVSAEKEEASAEKEEVSAEKEEIPAEKELPAEKEEVSAEKEEIPAEKELPAEKEEVSAEKEEIPAEREKDHGARSPLEMLAWFIKGAASLAAMVFFYKGLKWWVFRKRQSE